MSYFTMRALPRPQDVANSRRDRHDAIPGARAALSAVAAGCQCDDDSTPTPPPPICVEPAIDPSRSVVVNDVAGLSTRFPLRKTLQAMVTNSGGAGTPESLLQSMLASFSASSFQNADGRTIPVEPRPGEANLQVSQLLDPSAPDGMIPTGLFNRFDLAPRGGEHCGEYRITYAKKPGGTPGRFLLIFEAALPNPTPGGGLAACKPITDFWTSLSSENDANVRLDRLEQFYYTGVGTAGPVVHYANYGAELGQVRSNLFINSVQWRLREHRTNPLIASGASFLPDTVKENPLPELYRAGPLPGTITAADQQAVRDDFARKPLCNLTPDRANPGATPPEVVNGIGGGFLDAADDFESVSDSSDDPAQGTDPIFESAIATALTTLEPTTTLTSTDVLNRAGAMSCGGCHQFSNGKPLGHGTSWPASAGFVHIRENGDLSDALTQFLVPRRAEILGKFSCNQTPEPEAPCATAALAAAAAAPDLGELLNSAKSARARYVAALSEPAAAAQRSNLDALGRELSAAVDAARAAERALPGAFASQRRSH